MKIPQSKVTIPETTKNDTSLDCSRDRGGTIQYKPERTQLVYYYYLGSKPGRISEYVCCEWFAKYSIIHIGLVMKC